MIVPSLVSTSRTVGLHRAATYRTKRARHRKPRKSASGLITDRCAVREQFQGWLNTIGRSVAGAQLRLVANSRRVSAALQDAAGDREEALRAG
jgi:hypothetical protein